MTVAELIDELNKVEDKSKQVTIGIDLNKDIYVNDIVDSDNMVIIYN